MKKKETFGISLVRLSKTRVFDSTYLPEWVIISDGVNYQTHNRVLVGGGYGVDKRRSYTLQQNFVNDTHAMKEEESSLPD